MRLPKGLETAVAAILFVWATACATTSPSNEHSPAAGVGAASMAPYTIRSVRASDLAKLPATGSAYEVVQWLNWSPLLRQRAWTASVFVNGQFFGNLDALRSIPSGQIARMDLLSASAAAQAFGSGSSRPDGPVIAIETRRGKQSGRH